MTTLFGIPIDTFSTHLLIITGIIIAVVFILALMNAIFFKIGVRNIPRRRMQMILIIGALMLSTSLLSSVLMTGDVLTTTAQTVAVFNSGNVDELIEGGSGSLGLYSEAIYRRVRDRTQDDADILAVGAGLRIQDILLADQSSRQVRSKVTALGIVPGSEQGFGGMIDQETTRQRTISELDKNQVYLNATTAQFLNAHTGDKLYIYSERWPGERFQVDVAGIVSNDGLIGDNSFLLMDVQTLRGFEGIDDAFINQIYIRNHSGTEIGSATLTDAVTTRLERTLPRQVHVIQVKQEGLKNTQKAEDIFSRIFALFTLFSLAIGLLLILLIFVLLAAERRMEMGMARAIGVQRRHLVLMFLFEGVVYDLLASFVGLFFGVGGGAAIIWFLRPIMTRFDFPLKFSIQPRSFIIAYCLGVIFTFCSVVFSSWLVSRMNVIEALRDLPEPLQRASLRESLQRLWLTAKLLLRHATSKYHKEEAPWPFSSRRQLARHTALEIVPEVTTGIIILLAQVGILPLLAGWWLFDLGLREEKVLPFSLGFSLLVVGAGLMLKLLVERVLYTFNLRRRGRDNRAHSQRVAGGIFAALAGALLLAYWALPFDILAALGFRRFQGGIEIFFVAGIMMVLGATWAIIANAGLLVSPLLLMWSVFPRTYATLRLAAAYPMHRRFRMGLSVIMFSMVVFAMTVMAVITNSVQNSYADIDHQTGGYDIQATAYFKSLPDLPQSLEERGIDPAQISSIGVRSTTSVGVIQLSASAPRWSVYPAQIVDGGFLQGYGLHLSARARGFENDAAVWDALQRHPDYALIDSSALPYRSPFPVYDPSVPAASEVTVPAVPPSIDPQYAFSLSGVSQGDKSFSAVPLWLVGSSAKQAMKVTIIGVVDNSDAAHFGLYIPRSTTSVKTLESTSSISKPQSQTYYFKVAPGQDKRALALELGSAYLDYGLETTVLEDVIWQLRGPRILLSNVLIGVVGVTLLLGVAALAITGTRAVIERRQQIGMLRALGCSRRMVRQAFLLESFLVGAFGSILGVVLGVILARNIFAANFLEQYQTGLTFGIPWYYLACIVGISLFFSFLGALLPAWQAGRIAPAEALRYQ